MFKVRCSTKKAPQACFIYQVNGQTCTPGGGGLCRDLNKWAGAPGGGGLCRDVNRLIDVRLTYVHVSGICMPGARTRRHICIRTRARPRTSTSISQSSPGSGRLWVGGGPAQPESLVLMNALLCRPASTSRIKCYRNLVCCLIAILKLNCIYLN